MVYYFTSRCGQYTLYMGKDKYENEDLIKYGHPEDVWFHVDDLSSAHVYLRLKPGQSMDDISSDLLLDCATLVKANSIEGCKRRKVYVIYTRWKNLKKTAQMVDGQVSYHRPDNVRRVEVEKDNSITNALNKTRTEVFPHRKLYEEQQARLAEIQAEQKARQRKQDKEKKLAELEAARAKEERSYDRIMTEDNMKRNADFEATVDATAAVEYEEDFF